MAPNSSTLDRVILPTWSADRKPIPIEARWTLEDLMSARCVSIGELSRAAGVSREAVSRALRGIRTSTMPTRRRLAQALGVEPDLIVWNTPGRKTAHG
jgi:transcriptional regulator with XRE-family HTH domain